MGYNYLRDKSWMYKEENERFEDFYIAGVEYFIDFALKNSPGGQDALSCPCKKCENQYFRDSKTIKLHLIGNGFVRDYKKWYLHGENRKRPRDHEINYVFPSRDDIRGLLNAARPWSPTYEDGGTTEIPRRVGRDRDAQRFEKLINDAKQPLYPNCQKFSQLSFIVRLFQIKCVNKWSNKSVSSLLELLKELLPEGNLLPRNWYEARKVMDDLGLECKKIHACRNDCVLFRGGYEKLDACPLCKASRWKQRRGDAQGKDVPVKILRHFPLIPRLRRLFMSPQIAEDMMWHFNASKEENKMSHPRDSRAWKDFDMIHSNFSAEPRNVRLGLASDGFSPFKLMTGGNRSTWPVVLIPYNLPPWLAMKHPYFILSLLIDGPKSPGNDIDVYLQPLIEELKTLWIDGIDAYDAANDETFTMRAAVLWTINDFPAYGMLSGWSTKGYNACPSCHINHGSTYLTCSRKCVYLRHRRFLPPNHIWRNDKKNFNGKVEWDIAPVPLSGEDVLKQWENCSNITFGKTQKNANHFMPKGWKKKSIFFELPYWKTLLVRHNLDVMHIEKNVCDNILNTLICRDGRSKDNLNARRDLEKIKIRKSLHPVKLRPGKFVLPHASYNMNKEEKERFLRVLKDLKLPDGFSSNFSRQVQIREGKIIGLKSHDYHVLMQQLLPLAIRTSIMEPVGLALNEYCTFFRELCAKTIDIGTMEKLEKSIPVILCKLERIFPPSFFDVMVHLTIHLATEAKLGGPVQYRWMYPIERYLLTLKNYVRNRSRPEGSIAEGYLMEEATTFCSHYLDDVETKLNRPMRVPDGPLNKGKSRQLLAVDMDRAYRFILNNRESIRPYRELYESKVKRRHPDWNNHQVQVEGHANFVGWFRKHIGELKRQHVALDDEVVSLAFGPLPDAIFYTSFGVNGYKFETRSVEMARVTQNSGVVTVGDEHHMFYGVVDEILEIMFPKMESIVLFKCTWYDYKEGSGWKTDAYNLTSVNTTRTSYKDEPFVYPTQVQQVYYSKDLKNPNWSVVCRWKSRDTYDIPEDALLTQNEIEEDEIEEDDDNIISNIDPCIPPGGVMMGEGHFEWVRKDMGQGTVISEHDLDDAKNVGKRKIKKGNLKLLYKKLTF